MGRSGLDKDTIVDAAESLFSERGYAGVTLRDIGNLVNLRHASLYYHFPAGKEELFVAVTRRSLERHRRGLAAAIERSAPNIRDRLCAIASWLVSNAPMDLIRMVHADMPALSTRFAVELSELAFTSLILPVSAVLQDAIQTGEIFHDDPILVAGGLLGMVENLHAVPDNVRPEGKEWMAHRLVDTMITGLAPPGFAGNRPFGNASEGPTGQRKKE